MCLLIFSNESFSLHIERVFTFYSCFVYSVAIFHLINCERLANETCAIDFCDSKFGGNWCSIVVKNISSL